MASLCHIPKEIISSKKSTKSASWKLVPSPFVFAENLAQPLLENEIFEKSIYTRFVMAKVSKLVQISLVASLDSFFHRGFFENYKWPGTSFQATIFM